MKLFQKVYKERQKVQTSSPAISTNFINFSNITNFSIMTSPNMNHSFESSMDEFIPHTKLVKTRASATLAINERPFKTFKLKLELDKEQDNEAFGTISFDVTPVRTPGCTCPNAPKASKAKLILRLKNIKKLVFPEDEDSE